MAEPIFMKFGMYIMAPEPISTAHFIDPSHQAEEVLDATNTRNRIVGRVVFYAVRVISKKSRGLVLPITTCFYSTERHTGIIYPKTLQLDL
jgi:hypothetical protein